MAGDGSIPKRELLSDQAADYLREGINSGRWAGELPSEAELCRELKVSRVTLRKALGQLEREKWIEIGGRGRRHRIRRNRVRPPTKAAGGIIRLLTPYHPLEMGSLHQQVRRAISEAFGSEGYWIEVEHRPNLFERFKSAELARLDSKPNTAGWVLCFSTAKIQQWFESRDRPVVVLGRRHRGIKNLSTIYPDTEAMARHSVGLFRARGHSEIVYLIDEFTSLGDRMCAEEFVRAAAREGTRVQVVTHSRSRESVRRALNGVLAARPAPTAFFSTCPEHCVSVLCHLQAAGIRVPASVSLICGWDDSILDFTVPPLTRYRVHADLLGRKLGELLIDQLRHGPGKIREITLMPEVLSGGTLG
jgi:DNA-binding LacI/PurR family transcriptional regulator